MQDEFDIRKGSLISVFATSILVNSLLPGYKLAQKMYRTGFGQTKDLLERQLSTYAPPVVLVSDLESSLTNPQSSELRAF